MSVRTPSRTMEGGSRQAADGSTSPWRLVSGERDKRAEGGGGGGGGGGTIDAAGFRRAWTSLYVWFFEAGLILLGEPCCSHPPRHCARVLAKTQLMLGQMD
eukprot:753411-Hanusia_phi.AAC.1